jgi:hypothetical protein
MNTFHFSTFDYPSYVNLAAYIEVEKHAPVYIVAKIVGGTTYVVDARDIRSASANEFLIVAEVKSMILPTANNKDGQVLLNIVDPRYFTTGAQMAGPVEGAQVYTINRQTCIVAEQKVASPSSWFMPSTWGKAALPSPTDNLQQNLLCERRSDYSHPLPYGQSFFMGFFGTSGEKALRNVVEAVEEQERRTILEGKVIAAEKTVEVNSTPSATLETPASEASQTLYKMMSVDYLLAKKGEIAAIATNLESIIQGLQLKPTAGQMKLHLNDALAKFPPYIYTDSEYNPA